MSDGVIRFPLFLPCFTFPTVEECDSGNLLIGEWEVGSKFSLLEFKGFFFSLPKLLSLPWAPSPIPIRRGLNNVVCLLVQALD